MNCPLSRELKHAEGSGAGTEAEKRFLGTTSLDSFFPSFASLVLLRCISPAMILRADAENIFFKIS